MQKADFLTSFLDPVRAKILRLLILNAELFSPGDVAKRAGVSAADAHKELNALEAIGVVKKLEGEGKNARERKAGTRYSFNEKFRYANALSTFVHEVSPERFNDVERAIRGAGKMSAIVLSGVFIGDHRRPADLLLVADSVNEKRLEKVLRGFEPKYGREIRYTVLSTPEFRYRMTINDKLLRDTLDYPHRILLDKKNLI
ncbi:MAG: helix-turn-helix transcriptional regulator [Methylomonas sp.]|nr:helix-turn-helix transcriptional regulator [Methylomonas sp.]